MIRAHDLLVDQAVLVTEVLTGQAADQAGLLVDDILLSINGREVETVDDVHRLLSQSPMDATIELEIVRGNRRYNLWLFPHSSPNQ
jgi:S1-C subfamily serine protease